MGQFRSPLGLLWLVLGRFDLIWVVLADFGVGLGQDRSPFGLFWVALGRFGSVWFVLVRFVLLRSLVSAFKILQLKTKIISI